MHVHTYMQQSVYVICNPYLYIQIIYISMFYVRGGCCKDRLSKLCMYIHTYKGYVYMKMILLTSYKIKRIIKHSCTEVNLSSLIVSQLFFLVSCPRTKRQHLLTTAFGLVSQFRIPRNASDAHRSGLVREEQPGQTIPAFKVEKA